ncbi:MAG: flagellin [Alphaproteobacteria bacterium]|nr:flagellin [Alphaproteobacteria bacterium]
MKVNSALDSPQNFFAAQSINNRANDLNRLLDGISQSIRTIEEADNGITALTTLVEQANSIAQESLSEIRAAEGFASITGTVDLSVFDDLVTDSNGAIANGDDVNFTFFHEDVNSGAPITVGVNIATGDTIYDVVGTINSTATINPYLKASVDSNGRLKIESLYDGGIIRVGDGTTSPGADGFAFLGLDDLVGVEDTVATTRLAGSIVAGRTVTSKVSAAGKVNGKYEAGAQLDAAGFIDNFGTAATDDVTITLRVDDTSVIIGSYIDTDTIQELVDDINNSALSSSVTASFNVDTGRIELDYAETVGQAEITIESNDGTSTGDIAFGFASGVTGYGTIGGAADITLAAGDAAGEILNFVGTSANLTQFRDDYNNVREQIDGLVQDANYRGVNLLNGDDLTTYFNEDRDNSLVTDGVDFTSTGLGLDEVNFLTSLDVQNAIDATDAALASVRNFGTSIANDLAIIQTRRDFTESTINTLEAGADDLTLADQNEEGANLLALQTRQTLGVTSLSLASQSQQAVLRLF